MIKRAHIFAVPNLRTRTEFYKRKGLIFLKGGDRKEKKQSK